MRDDSDRRQPPSPLRHAASIVLGSLPHAVWAASFAALNLVYIPIVEEPQLRRRFGERYGEYCRHVRRFVPRLRPWSSGT